MVAISAYRGKLHKVPDVPRKWVIPTPSISPKDFKLLLLRRSKALALLHSPSTSNPNQEPLIHQDNNNNNNYNYNDQQPQNLNRDDSTQPQLQFDPPPDLDDDKNDSKPVFEVSVQAKPSEAIYSDLGDKLGEEITHIASNPIPVII